MCRILLTLILFFVGLFPLYAEEIREESQHEYHPRISLYLGSGFDPIDMTEARPFCFNPVGAGVPLDGNGAYSTSFTTRLVSSVRELFESVGVSTSVEAQGFFMSGKASMSHLSESLFQEDSLTLLVKGEVDYGRFGSTNLVLLPGAQELINSGHHAQFATRCGTRYVDKVRKGASIFALYTVQGLRQEHRSSLETSLKVGGGFGPISAAVEVQFKNAMAQIAASSTVQIRIFALGGAGITQFSNIPSSVNDLPSIKTQLGNYMSQMTSANAVPLIYSSGSMKAFGWQSVSQFDLSFRDEVLKEYYFLTLELQNIRIRLHKILFRSRDSQDQARQGFQERFDQCTTAINRLKSEAKACLLDPRVCQYPKLEFDPDSIVWPEPVDLKKGSRCNYHQKRALELGHITQSEYNDFIALKVAPIPLLDDWSMIGYIDCATHYRE